MLPRHAAKQCMQLDDQPTGSIAAVSAVFAVSAVSPLPVPSKEGMEISGTGAVVGSAAGSAAGSGVTSSGVISLVSIRPASAGCAS